MMGADDPTTNERVLLRDLAPTSPASGRTTWRGRLLFGLGALLALNAVLTLGVLQIVLTIASDERIADELEAELRELQELATGVGPEATADSGTPYGDDVEEVFRAYLQTNVPSEFETVVTLVDGQPFLRSSVEPPVRLVDDPEFVATLADIEGRTSGRLSTEVGRVDWLAVPVRGDRDGVFAVAVFRDLALAEERRAVLLAGGAQIAAGVLALLMLGRLATERLSQPLADMTDTTRTIGATDLSSRLPVSGDDEVTELAETINGLLARLEAALATQRRFVADAGHELRTPITIVQGHLDLLEDDPLERARTLELVQDELDRMSLLVNDLLTLATVEQPDFVRREVVDLDEFGERLVDTLRPLAPRHWRLVSSGGTGTFDPTRTRQAVIALADNAVRHTREGGRISLRLVRDGDRTVVSVVDDGEGIPEAEQARIFSRFARAQVSRRTSGAGLGLSLVAAIAEAHGGAAELASRPGEGTTVSLILPDEPTTGTA